MTVGIGGHLWPHALSWHEVALAIACQFQPTPGFPIPPPLPLPFRPPFTRFSRPSYLVPCFCSSSLPQNPAPLLSRCLTMLTACREEGEGENTHIHIHTQGCGCVQRARRRRTKFRVCNHVALLPIRKRLIVDTGRGENC